MEITLRKFVSDVLTAVKADNLDDKISYRYILSRSLNKAKTFIKQDSDARRLFKVSEAWKRIPCISLKPVDIVECGIYIPGCRSLMRSCDKLPQVYQTSYGNILKVFTVDMSKEFKQTSFPEYKEISRREWKNPNVIYFILQDGYIWIPDSEIEEVTGLGLFKDPFAVTKYIEPATCAKPLDELFPCPDYLLEAIMKDMLSELMPRTQIKEDERPNQNENER